MATPTVAHSVAKRRSPPRGIHPDWPRTALVCGGDDVEILCGHPPDGGSCLGVGAPDRRAWPGRKPQRDPLSGGASGLQWPQTLGRALAAGCPSAASPCRGPCATGPAIAHQCDLHTPHGPSGLASAERTGLERGALALTPYHGRGTQSPGLSLPQGGAGQAAQEEQRDGCALRP